MSRWWAWLPLIDKLPGWSVSQDWGVLMCILFFPNIVTSGSKNKQDCCSKEAQSRLQKRGFHTNLCCHGGEVFDKHLNKRLSTIVCHPTPTGARWQNFVLVCLLKVVIIYLVFFRCRRSSSGRMAQQWRSSVSKRDAEFTEAQRASSSFYCRCVESMFKPPAEKPWETMTSASLQSNTHQICI